MTTQDAIREIESHVEAALTAFNLAVATTHAQQVQRIFEAGKSGNGGDIGKYNTTKPLYINPKKSPRKFDRKGKSGKEKKKNGEPHKTGYFQSYAAFRRAINAGTDRVDLKLWGNLESDFRASLTEKGTGILVSGVERRENIGKVLGAKRKYGEAVFELSKEEKETLQKVADYELKKAIGNA